MVACRIGSVAGTCTIGTGSRGALDPKDETSRTVALTLRDYVDAAA